MQYTIVWRWGLWRWEIPNEQQGYALTKFKAKRRAERALAVLKSEGRDGSPIKFRRIETGYYRSGRKRK